MFPPLRDSSFSEQYKTFKAFGGKTIANNLEMSKDLQMRIKPVAANKPYYRRNLRGPAFGEPDHQTYGANMMHPGLG